MASLFDLSNEILLKIADYIQRSSPNALSALSRVCKRLNACCGYWVFREYHLRLRTPEIGQKPLTNFDNTETFKSWNFEAVTARIKHFYNKAPYVKVLILEDWKSDEQKDSAEPDHFPECIIQDLLDALSGANRVVSVEVISGYGGTLPLPLWEWITTKDLTELKVGGLLAPPPNARMHHKVQSFEGRLYSESIPFLDLVRPESIKLCYFRFYDNPPQIAPYKPSGSHNTQLRKIILELDLPSEFEKPLFDFSGVPEATISATFYPGVQLKIQIPAAWQRLKVKLPTIFAEGLYNYDVNRPYRREVYVTRPTMAEIEAGWKPSNAAHLEGEAEAREESSQMEQYWAHRTRQQLRSLIPSR